MDGARDCSWSYRPPSTFRDRDTGGSERGRGLRAPEDWPSKGLIEIRDVTAYHKHCISIDFHIAYPNNF
jgi:hypothetical protein